MRELEGKLGNLPWNNQYPEYTPENNAAIKEWLMLQGMPKAKIDNLDWTRLCSAILV
jgi:hypothetical protein